MAKSPKTHNKVVPQPVPQPLPQQISSSTSSIISNKDGSKELKSILKEPRREPRKEKLPPPPTVAPTSTSTPVLQPVKSEEKIDEQDEEEDELDEEDDEKEDGDDDYYHNLFYDIIKEELPDVNQNPADAGKDSYYPYDHFQDDVVCVLAEIYENSGYLVIPDTDMVQKIAKLKIKDSKLQNEFIFGTDKNIDGGIYSVIKKYTDPIRKSQWDNFEKKYSEEE